MRRRNQPGCPCCKNNDNPCGTPCGVCPDDYIVGFPTVAWNNLSVTQPLGPPIVGSGSDTASNRDIAGLSVTPVHHYVGGIPFYYFCQSAVSPAYFIAIGVGCNNGVTFCTLFLLYNSFSGPAGIPVSATKNGPQITCSATEIVAKYDNWIIPRIIDPFTGTTICQITLGSTTVTWPIHKPRPQVCCFPCPIPKKNLVLSWVNPTWGNGSASLVYNSGSETWTGDELLHTSSKDYTLSWTVRCVSEAISAQVILSDGVSSHTYMVPTDIKLSVGICDPLHMQLTPVPGNALSTTYGFTGWFADE